MSNCPIDIDLIFNVDDIPKVIQCLAIGETLILFVIISTTQKGLVV